MDALALRTAPRLEWRFAAIDIGSNAVRLLISDVSQQGRRVFVKENTRIRVPLRLGQESFARGEIGGAMRRDLLKALGAFVQLTQVVGVDGLLACATAALREASNRAAIVDEARQACGLDIQVISGAEEADFIFSTYVNELPFRKGAFLFFDIGGGSTEIAFYQGGTVQATRSFAIGTVRMLTQGVSGTLWDELRFWLREQAGRIRAGKWMGVGSGGNVKELARIAAKKPVSLKRIDALRENLEAASLEQRIAKYGLTSERAEVIVPAAQILAFVLGSAGVEKLHVPKIGLLEGIVSRLYFDRRTRALAKAGPLEFRWN